MRLDFVKRKNSKIPLPWYPDVSDRPIRNRFERDKQYSDIRIKYPELPG